VIFITDRPDLRKAVQAIKAGAIDMFPKPLESAALMSAMETALEASRAALNQTAQFERLKSRYSTLSDRERDVMILVAKGLLNKQVACELGITEATVKAHRGQVTRKMQTKSIVGLVHMSGKLGICPEPGW
jgi:FixJ family two-component response regulator